MRIQTTADKINKGLDKITSEGGRSNLQQDGDKVTGQVSVKGVKASWKFNTSTNLLEVSITDKPWLVSESYVEDEIKKFFT